MLQAVPQAGRPTDTDVDDTENMHTAALPQPPQHKRTVQRPRVNSCSWPALDHCRQSCSASLPKAPTNLRQVIAEAELHTRKSSIKEQSVPYSNHPLLMLVEKEGGTFHLPTLQVQTVSTRHSQGLLTIHSCRHGQKHAGDMLST